MPHPRDMPVAGIDVGATRVEAADRVVGTLVAVLRRRGFGPDALRVGIHRIVHEDAPGGTHVAVSYAVTDLEQKDLTRLSATVASAVRGSWSLTTSSFGADGPDPAGMLPASTPTRRRDPLTRSVGYAVGSRRHGDAALATTAMAAAREQQDRCGGRAVHFDGAPLLRGPMSVADIMACSAIDTVLDLSSDLHPRPEDLVLLGAAVRPRWQFGSLVLHVWPAPGTTGGVYLPFDAARATASLPG